jgi:hypothetical protein
MSKHTLHYDDDFNEISRIIASSGGKKPPRRPPIPPKKSHYLDYETYSPPSSPEVQFVGEIPAIEDFPPIPRTRTQDEDEYYGIKLESQSQSQAAEEHFIPPLVKLEDQPPLYRLLISLMKNGFKA